MSNSIILVGSGNMGHALLEGWIETGSVAPSDIVVVEPHLENQARVTQLGVTAVATHADPACNRSFDLVVLAVKPQTLPAVAPAYKHIIDYGASVLSIAAGTSMATLHDIFGASAPVIRTMPNIAASIRASATAVFFGGHVSEQMRGYVLRLFSAVGIAVEIDDENQLDAVTAVSGSGPAYVFHLMECLAAAGEAAGLPSETARVLSMQTIIGAAKLAEQTKLPASTLRERVTSPNGTTEAALGVLMGGKQLQSLIAKAVLAAQDRSLDLAT